MTKTETSKILRYAKKIKALNYLGNKCKNCSNNNYFSLTFHHINPDEKEFGYYDLKENRWSLIEKELDKCELLCFNCHLEFHFINNPLFDIKEMDKNKSIYNKRKNKSIYLEYKGSECSKCGYNKCQAALTFHHRNPNEKEFILSSVKERFNNINELNIEVKNEMDKCDLLCCNCHNTEHGDIDFFERYRDLIYEKVNNYKEKSPKIDRELIKKMYNSGLKKIEIGKMLKINRATISRILIKINGVN